MEKGDPVLVSVSPPEEVSPGWYAVDIHAGKSRPANSEHFVMTAEVLPTIRDRVELDQQAESAIREAVQSKTPIEVWGTLKQRDLNIQ